MNSNKLALYLVSSLCILSPLLIPIATADDFLSPLFSPIINEICNHVGCGQGSCKATSNSTFGYECECNSGWSQLHIGDSLRFLPCIIPNCSIDYSCSNHSFAPAPAPSLDNKNFSLFDSCSWNYCGGGTCIKTSDTDGHKCECNEGYSNLLNITTLPCYKSCSLGANCANLGLKPLSTSSSPPAPKSLSDSSSASDTGMFATNNLLMLLFLIPFLIIQAI
ncbi:Neurogenic locus notch protein-like [Rhynchospora pubera]|uniref:Neurogenic locus notch protein-like n=1 Tax=Rhynchospora pubera TaxID=906938 RepID=A0AAV8HW04_9POAL|nr:Neurogenic locus notch protein-like [Rhynchospora pubera]